MPRSQRTIGLLGAVAISLGLISPSMAVSFNTEVIVKEVGASAPLVFLLAAAPVIVMAAAFAVLARRFGAEGSTFGLLGASVGPRTGTTTGLWLLATYVACVANYVFVIGTILGNVGETAGFAGMASAAVVMVIGLIGLTLGLALALRPLPRVGSVLLILQNVTMALILLVCAFTFIVLVMRGGPEGQRPELSVFTLDGVTPMALGLGLSFAVLCVAGFEAATTTAGSTRDPKRTVPRAILITAIAAVAFYLVVMTVSVWAIGTNQDELDALVNSASIPAAVATKYVGSGAGAILVIGAALSAFGGLVAALVGASRLVAAYARSGLLPRRLEHVSRRGEPNTAAYVLVACSLVLIGTALVMSGFQPFDAFTLWGTVISVLFTAVYGAVCGAACLVLARERRWLASLACAMGGLVVLLILSLTLFPLPSGGLALVASLASMAVLIACAAIGAWRGSRAWDALQAREPVGTEASDAFTSSPQT